MSGQKSGVARGFVVLLLLAALLGVVPGTFAKAAEQQILKVALAIPRTQELAIEVKKYNDKLAAMTDNAVQVRVYYGGAAGDDTDVLRKLKTGQMDAAPFVLELVSNFVRQALVLASPAMFTNYKQLDAVRAALTPDFDKEAYDNGFKIMGWGDVGRLRLLSKAPIATLDEFRKVRPWLYPESPMLKDFYKLVGATGIPLPIAEVYPGLQTNMIDVVWGSAVLASALQWHTGTHYITQQGLGFITGAFVIRRAAWEALPEVVRKSMWDLAEEQRQKNQIDVRKADELAYQKLVSRGHKPITITDVPAWQKAGLAVREHMIGRVYTKEIVTRAEEIAKKYPD